jgi:hypothetical protein
MAKDYVERPRSVAELAQMFRDALAKAEPPSPLPLTVAASADPTQRTQMKAATPATAATPAAKADRGVLMVVLFAAVFVVAIVMGIIIAVMLRRS